MRGGIAVLLFSLLLGCSSSETVPDKSEKIDPTPKRDEVSRPEEIPKNTDADRTLDFSKVGVDRVVEPEKGSIKGSQTPEARGADAKSDVGDAILLAQRQRYAKDPSSDVEKMRLALLYLTVGDYPEAERLLALVREKSDLFPYLEAYLYRKLGETQEAGKRHRKLHEEWKQADGFKIERAALVSSVRGFARYDLQTNGKVAPGETAIIYVQPENFTLKQDGDLFILHLGYDWRLFDERNQEVSVPWWENANPNDRFDFIKFCGPASEFHQYFLLKLPTNLATGNYRIRITVTDKNTEREDRIYVPIYVIPTQ